jgi:hypothetical protein
LQILGSYIALGPLILGDSLVLHLALFLSLDNEEQLGARRRSYRRSSIPTWGQPDQANPSTLAHSTAILELTVRFKDALFVFSEPPRYSGSQVVSWSWHLQIRLWQAYTIRGPLPVSLTIGYVLASGLLTIYNPGA